MVMKNGMLFWGERVVATDRKFRKSKFDVETLKNAKEIIENAIAAACKKHNSQPALIVQIRDWSSPAPKRSLCGFLQVAENEHSIIDCLFYNLGVNLKTMVETHKARMNGNEDAWCKEDAVVHCSDYEMCLVFNKYLYVYIRPLFGYDKNVEYSFYKSPKLGRYIPSIYVLKAAAK